MSKDPQDVVKIVGASRLPWNPVTWVRRRHGGLALVPTPELLAQASGLPTEDELQRQWDHDRSRPAAQLAAAVKRARAGA